MYVELQKSPVFNSMIPRGNLGLSYWYPTRNERKFLLGLHSFRIADSRQVPRPYTFVGFRSDVCDANYDVGRFYVID